MASLDQETLRTFLREQKIATLAELKSALGSSATMTAFRKLKALGYQTSYSHRGRYYTLAGIPRFDEEGCGATARCGFPETGGCWPRRNGSWRTPLRG